MSASATVHERCVWIVDYLRRSEDKTERAIRDMWEAAKRSKEDGGLEDVASLPTYHRTVAKLVRQGQLEEDGNAADGSALYRAADQLSPLNTYTLTDLNEALWELSASEALALYLDAVDYYESRAAEVLTKAAALLLNENPRQLIVHMLKDLAEELEEDRDILGDPEASEPTHRSLMRRRCDDLRRFVYSELGLSANVWHLPSTLEELEGGADLKPADWGAVERAVSERVYGDTFIQPIRLPALNATESELVVAGSDGSSHAGYVRGIPAPRYVEEEGRLVLVFNNSIAYIELPKDFPSRLPSPYHGVPMTRAALEDPQNRGMVISRPWFQDLTDSEYEHMKKAALDVVQFRVDERLMTGAAMAYGTNPAGGNYGLLPTPNVLIRDGTVTPQEREFQHYINPKPGYGDVVREGITLSYSILRAVKDSETRVYAGAVKSTQLRSFSRIINWYVKKYVDEGWDLSKVSNVTDTVAVTRLLSLSPALPSDHYYRTAVIVRPFWAMDTNFRGHRIDDSRDSWLQEFRRRRDAQTREWREHGGEPPRLPPNLEDDPFVRMCQEADYAAFYFGRPAKGEPDLTLPRFEFMDALRRRPLEGREHRVARATELIIAGVHMTKWSQDREHNFMTQRRLPRLIPFVVYQAHEACKTLGHKLEAELKQAIAMRLSQLKKLRGLPVPKVLIEPIPVKEYLANLQRRLLGSGQSNSATEGRNE